MWRRSTWRKGPSEVVTWRQEQALSTTILLLNQFGPTAFLLNEQDTDKHYRVCLGDPHTCTCTTFQREKELCKHICWILLRRFRLPRDHEYCFQSGLVERQIVEVLRGLHTIRTPPPVDPKPSDPPQVDLSEGDGTVKKQTIGEDDVCPICQEELLKKRRPVTHCRFGCGNNVHISCMKVWADHQTRSGNDIMVKCPLCREDFCPLTLLLEMVKNTRKMCTASEREPLDKHLGIPCNSCRVCPVVGQCFKCSVCRYYHLCEDCLVFRCHPQHSFLERMKRNRPWKPVGQNVDHLPSKVQITDRHFSQTSLNYLPDAFTTKASTEVYDPVPGHVLRSLPTTKVQQRSKLLEPGVQCLYCLRDFCLGQRVKTLPCQHQFHADCIKSWLGQSSCCPLDWQAIYNPLLSANANEEKSNKAPSRAGADGERTELFVPGVGLQSRFVRTPALRIEPRLEAFPPLSTEPVTKGVQIHCLKTTSGAEQNSPPCEPLGSLPVPIPIPIPACRKRMEVKASFPNGSSPLASAPVLRRTEGLVRAQPNLSLGLNQPLRRGQIRPPLWGKQPSRQWCGRGDVGGLWMTGVPIHIKKTQARAEVR